MGITRTDLYTEQQNELARLAKVLGHPARIAIIENLLQKPDCACGFFVEEIGLAQATISQHLKELKQAGLIQGSVEGTSVCYCINAQKWKKMEALFKGIFGRFDRGKCCG
jgi:DNA-binding transcriptional ArsR family regulator